MAGTRRGPHGSGRPTRAETRKAARARTLQQRLADARSPRDQVSAASQHLRSVMADPHLPATVAETAAKQVTAYLTAVATQLEGHLRKGGR